MQYLQVFADKEELLTPFDDAERGRLFTAMLKYALHCEEMELPGNERFIWPVFKQMIDQSRKALDNKRKGGEARQQAAAESSASQQAAAESSASQQAAAESSASQQAAAESSASQQAAADHKQPTAQRRINQESRINNQESRNKNNNDGEDKRARRARFTPPTVDDVLKYAKETATTIDAQRFVDFYASKGWVVGTSPMKDWRAAVRNWCKRDAAPPGNTFSPAQRIGKQVGAQQYTQRDYTENDLDSTTIELLEQARQL